MTPERREAFDPSAYPGVFVQPDQTTCGSSSLVMARMLNDPAYATHILGGNSPRPGTGIADPADIARRFREDVLAMHRQTSSFVTHGGRFNRWWPQAWGTSPGAVARQMSGGAGASGVPGTRYAVRYVDKADRADIFDAIMRAVNDGHAVPVFTYDIHNATGASGGHVTLAVGTDGDNLRVYDPGHGRVATVTPQDFREARLQNSLGWNRPGAAVLPVADRRRARR